MRADCLRRYANVAVAVATQQAGDASNLELQTQLLLELVSHLRTALLEGRGDHPSHRMCADRNNDPSPLSPLWMRRVSAMLLKIGGVVVPLLQLCAQHAPSAVRHYGLVMSLSLPDNPRFAHDRKKRRKIKRRRTRSARQTAAKR